MRIKKTTRWSIACALAGYGIVHPLVMILARFMFSANMGSESGWSSHTASAIVDSFSLPMLPWGAAFAVLSAVAGWSFLRKREIEAGDARLQGVLELAGAACHELRQPMQIVMGYAQMLDADLPADDPRRRELKAIIEEIDRMSLILTRIQSITRYATLDYVDGLKIIDIEKASRPPG